MRFIVLAAAAAILTPACFANNPEPVEFYNLSVNGDQSSLIVNARPNLDVQVKRIIGTTDTGEMYVVDLCLGVTDGAYLNPVARENVMLCVGEAADNRGTVSDMWGCYDGRASAAGSPTTVNVQREDLANDISVVTGSVGVTIPNFGNNGGVVDVVTDFSVRVEVAPEGTEEEDEGNVWTMPWGMD